MNLIADIGNTFVKVGIFNSVELEQHFQIDKKDFKEEVSKLLEKYPIQNSVISKVSDVGQEALELLENKTKFVIFDTSTPSPLFNKYGTPETLGADRLAAAIGSYYLFKNQNILIIDAGTCITYDVVTQKREFLGGAISPGIKMRLKALHTFTSKLPLIDPKTSPPMTGDTTSSSILSGVMNGIYDEIRGRINFYSQQYDNLIVIGTGGDICFFDNDIKNTIFADPNLILKGLNYLIQYNYQK